MHRSIFLAALLSLAASSGCLGDGDDLGDYETAESAANPGTANYINRVVLEGLDFTSPPSYPISGWTPPDGEGRDGRAKLIVDAKLALTGDTLAVYRMVRGAAMTTERYFVMTPQNSAREAFIADWDLLPHLEGRR
jgi:hypothetical protein